MQWSQIKKRAEEFIVPELQGRVQFYITTYRRDPDSDSPPSGRGWITIDGNEELSAPSDTSTPNRQDLYEALAGYPGLSIDAALSSDNIIVRGLAMVDRRLGKRRLAAIDVEQEHPFVQRLLLLRREVTEGSAES